MSILDHAIAHIRAGRPIFPGIPGEKTPAIKNPYAVQTVDERQVIRWWKENPEYNILLPMGVEIAPGQFLGAMDFDLKGENNGFETAGKLAMLGFEFPDTLEQATPNNGIHKLYLFDFPIGNGAGFIGKGIDHRGFHGYIVGSGSWHHGKEYRFKNQLEVAKAPEWLSSKLLTRKVPELERLRLIHNVDQETAERRAREFLDQLSPAKEGERNQRCYEAACRLKDFGLNSEAAKECIFTNWKSEPVLEKGEIENTVNSAYAHSQNQPGILAPENVFDEIKEPPPEKKPKHPVDQLNEKYALLVHGGVRILSEENIDGELRVDHLSVQAFHDIEANNLISIEDKTIAVSKMWMKSKKRRQYAGIVFAPQGANPKLYNVWKGFPAYLSVPEPVKPEAQKALDLFLEHIRDNVCGGNLEWTNWVIGFFAHLIQHPGKKPGVALVLRGRKGVGKNVITDCIFRLLGDHCILAANRRYISGNFNAHLENKLLLVLDEAFWSGDKASEGILKDLITGSTHQIERKGHDPYPVQNIVRVVVFGNEEWIVPATDDERRFAVFNVGDAKRGDREYFGKIKDGMSNGGDRLLFKYLKEFDLSSVDVNVAPETDALMSQKEHTLGLVDSWWLGCLKSGHIGANEEWPTEMPREQMRTSFYDQMKKQNIGGRLPTPMYFGRQFRKMAPSSCKEVMKREGEIRYRVQEIAHLETARAEWELYMRGKVDWND